MIFFTLVFIHSCQNDRFEYEFEPQTFIQECIDEFNQMSKSSSPSSNATKEEHPLAGIYKQPDWSLAYLRNISLGHAAVIRLSFSENFFSKPGEKGEKLIPLEQLSYLMMYRNGNGKMVAEFVIVTPTAVNNDEESPNKKPFCGTIQIYDWQLSFQRGYRYTHDGQILCLDRPQFTFLSEKERENWGSQKYQQEDCDITDWYSCPGSASTVTSECTYLYTEVDCSSTDSGDGTGGGDGSGNSSGGVTPNPGDYPTGGGGGSGYNPNIPSNPSKPTLPCTGSPLVTMQICPTQNSGVRGGEPTAGEERNVIITVNWSPNSMMDLTFMQSPTHRCTPHGIMGWWLARWLATFPPTITMV